VTARAEPDGLEGVLETVLYHEPGDADAMLDLYRDLLGLPVVAEWDDGTALRIGAGVVLLFDRVKLARRDGPIADHATTGSSHVAFLVSPERYQGWRSRLEEAGVDLVHEQEWGEGRRSLYFRDPADNLIEIVGGDIWPPAPAESSGE
jgi:catechol 2,3-dioxygenase-like lactoylglutathione lyase family enzyme